MRINKHSLQLKLYLWIIASTLLVLLLGGTISGAIAFFQARELQDNTLKEIALLVRDNQLTATKIDAESFSKPGSYKKLKNIGGNQEEDTSVLLLEIDNEMFSSRGKSKWLTPGKGLQTLTIFDEQWRALVVRKKSTNQTFLIAQPTELRDEIAVASAMSTLYPLLIFAVGLLFLIHWVLRKPFNNIKQLTQSLDQQTGDHLITLNEQKVPSEIQPFIQSINDLMQRVQSSMEKQQRFIADAAHELRTPIAALSLQTENLKNAANEQEREQRLSALQQGFLRLGKLVSQLLDLARLQANKDSTQAEISPVTKTNLNTLVKHTIEEIYPIAEQRNIDLGVLRQEDNLFINDPQGLLAQVINNAISNAIHYSPDNGEVNISLFSENHLAVLLVEDTGIGIPEDELEKVMQPFYRVLGGTQEGNGLGLTISQEIADKLGGRIHLTNRDEGGLVFRYEQAIA